jgi:hypothetical protein
VSDSESTPLEALTAGLLDLERIRRACATVVAAAHAEAAHPTGNPDPVRERLVEELALVHDYLTVIHRDGIGLIADAQIEVRRALPTGHPSSELPAS